MRGGLYTRDEGCGVAVAHLAERLPVARVDVAGAEHSPHGHLVRPRVRSRHLAVVTSKSGGHSSMHTEQRSAVQTIQSTTVPSRQVDHENRAPRKAGRLASDSTASQCSSKQPRSGTHNAEKVVVRDAEDALGLLDGVLEAGLPDLGPVRAAERFGLELRRRPSEPYRKIVTRGGGGG